MKQRKPPKIIYIALPDKPKKKPVKVKRKPIVRKNIGREYAESWRL